MQRPFVSQRPLFEQSPSDWHGKLACAVNSNADMQLASSSSACGRMLLSGSYESGFVCNGSFFVLLEASAGSGSSFFLLSTV